MTAQRSSQSHADVTADVHFAIRDASPLPQSYACSSLMRGSVCTMYKRVRHSARTRRARSVIIAITHRHAPRHLRLAINVLPGCTAQHPAVPCVVLQWLEAALAECSLQPACSTLALTQDHAPLQRLHETHMLALSAWLLASTCQTRVNPMCHIAQVSSRCRTCLCLCFGQPAQLQHGNNLSGRT